MNILTKTRVKFSSVIISILFIVFLSINLAVDIQLITNEKSQVNLILDNGIKDGSKTIERANPNKIRTFYYEYTTTGEVVKSTYNTNYYTQENIDNYISTIKLLENGKGIIETYINYFKTTKMNSTNILIVGTNRSIEINQMNSTILSMSLSTSAAFIILSIGTLFLVRFLVKPLEKSIKNQKRFISDASHDLKTPIAIIDANASVIKEEYKDNKYINNIIDESKKLNQLVVDLLEISKIEEGALYDKNEITNFNLSESIESIALSFEALAYENKLKFVTHINKDINYKGNKKDIERIINILIDNSLKYSSSYVHISLTKVKKIITFTVKNDGYGIPKDEIEKIYERFYRVDKARSNNIKSFGLGLSMAKTLIDKNKLKITVKSEINKFTEFTVTF